MPLALRRFAQSFGLGGPVRTMKVAAERVLTRYFDRGCFPVRVQQLCEICEVGLVGYRPMSRPGLGYADCDHHARKGPTAKLFMENSRLLIKIPARVDYATARISVAHELGHSLIHRNDKGFDDVTLRLPTSPEEEALAEYCARMLLMPQWRSSIPRCRNLAEYAVSQSSQAGVTMHSAVTRLGDPDVSLGDIRGAILWRLNSAASTSYPIHARLSPYWHLCPNSFVPIRRCKARAGSLISLIAAESGAVSGTNVEDVSIGSFTGVFVVDAFGWGSTDDGTRLVLSIFRIPTDQDQNQRHCPASEVLLPRSQFGDRGVLPI